MTAVGIFGEELLSAFTVEAYAGCTASATFVVPDDVTLTQSSGPVRFDRNRATGSGGAVFLAESCSADLDRIDFSGNTATVDGGALFVDLGGALSLSRSTLRDNVASRHGGAMSVGVIATIRINQTTARDNIAGGSGGALRLTGIAAASLQGFEAVSNKAGAVGGAMAVYDATRTLITLSNSTILGNRGSIGGALFTQDSEMNVEGVQFIANSAEVDGGAVAASGIETVLELSDAECVNVHVLLDWTTAGEDGCPVGSQDVTCLACMVYFDVTCGKTRYGVSCNGCDCNDKYVCLVLERFEELPS